MHRHQLDRRDPPQLLEVVDDRRVGDRGVRAAAALRDVGMRLGQALDVGLVDDRVGVLVLRRPVGAPPVEEWVDHDGLGHAGRRVVVVAAVGVAEVVGEQRLIHWKVPSMAFAYGSSSSLFGLQRCPDGGSYGPCTR